MHELWITNIHLAVIIQFNCSLKESTSTHAPLLAHFTLKTPDRKPVQQIPIERGWEDTDGGNRDIHCASGR